MNPLQGETIFFSGFLKDDNNTIITDFDPYIFRAFIKSKMQSNTFLFSTASSGDTKISVGSGTTAGLLTWELIPAQSKLLQGETVLEIDCTEVSGGTKKLGKTIVFYVEETGISKHINF